MRRGAGGGRRNTVERMGIFRALQLGDLLCTVPAWRALRAAYPKARITLIGLPWARDFARRYVHYIDEYIEFPGAPGLPERKADAAAYPAFLETVRARAFDLLLQMHGSGQLTNPLLDSWGATRIAGFHPAPERRDETRIFLSWDDREHEVKRYLRLAAALGARSRGEHLEFPVSPAERQELARVYDPGRAPYACIHPGARYLSRRWAPARFAAVADALGARGLEIVITGAAEERALAQEVMWRMRRRAIDLTGSTTLPTFAALVSRACIVVSNDTGMSHVAAAVHTPSVIVSSGGDAERWRPLDARRHRVLWRDVPCRPCAHRVCPTAHECADGVTAEDVLREAASLLDQEEPRAA